jgi:hypothetical protein
MSAAEAAKKMEYLSMDFVPTAIFRTGYKNSGHDVIKFRMVIPVQITLNPQR